MTLNLSLSPYQHFSETEWSHDKSRTSLTLNQDELDDLSGFNEHVSLRQAENIYLPLCQLLNFHVRSAQLLHEATRSFLGSSYTKVPYIIGVSGSVAVGKSTTSRILQTLLSRFENHRHVSVITTDGFLYPNEELEKRKLLERKGFPESFDTKKMIEVLTAIKSGAKEIITPLYSHEQYDIIKNKQHIIKNFDIVIVEGLNILNTNTLSNKKTSPFFISDFLDFSIYVDAQTKFIETWYLERFLAFRKKAENNPECYFYRFFTMSDNDAYAYAKQVWKKINEANLVENILPYKNRAHLILKKELNHCIKSLYLRRL